MRVLAVQMMFRELPFYNETHRFSHQKQNLYKICDISVAKPPHGILMEELAGNLRAISIA